MLFLPIQAIETQYAGSQIELFGGEAIFDGNSDEVVLNIDKDGETAEEGWRIRPCVYPPLVRSEICVGNDYILELSIPMWYVILLSPHIDKDGKCWLLQTWSTTSYMQAASTSFH